MESNWRFWVWESGLTEWSTSFPGQPVFNWKYIAPLRTRLPPPFGFIDAVAMQDRPTGSVIFGMVLLEGGYPELWGYLGDPNNTHFPGPYDVIPDYPPVSWPT